MGKKCVEGIKKKSKEKLNCTNQVQIVRKNVLRQNITKKNNTNIFEAKVIRIASLFMFL